MAPFWVKVRSEEGEFREVKLGPGQSVDIRDKADQEVKKLATIQALGKGLTQDIQIRTHEPSQEIRFFRPDGRTPPPGRFTGEQEDLIREFGWPQPRTDMRLRSGLFRESAITAVNLTDEDGLVASVVWKDE